MKEEKRAKARKEPEKQGKEAAGRSKYLYPVAIAIAIVVIVAGLVLASGAFTGVSFASFKHNFLSSKSVAVVVYAYNTSIYDSLEVYCQNDVIQYITSHASPPAMNIYIIYNSSLCYYESDLGKVISGNTIPTSSEAGCISNSSAYPSITLSYGQYNATSITPYHMSIQGDAAYMRSCPIAVDIS